MSWRVALGLAFFAAQLAWLWPSTWAPFHEHAVYRLAMDVDGGTLGTKALLERFHLSTWHYAAARDENWETNRLDAVVDLIERARPPAPVRVEGSVNGRPFVRVIDPRAGGRP